jgi:thiol:disulfide interchange protein DsbA
MKRRDFNLATLRVATTAAVVSNASAWAQNAAAKPTSGPINLKEGKDYQKLERPLVPDAGAGKIEVIEFFWYSCPHCNAFEPTFANWAKTAPKDLMIRRIPVAFNDSFAPQQRLFFALEALNLLESLHVKVFTAVHVEKQALNTDASIQAWVEKQGVDKTKFAEAYKSFGMTSKLRRAVQLQNEFKVEGVPSLGIAGRFYTDGSLAGSMERALQVAEGLLAQVRQGK